MSEDEEPGPPDEVSKGSEHLVGQVGPLMRQMEPYLQAQEAWRRQMEPMIQAHERLRRQMEPILRAHEAYRRQIEPITRALEQFARIANWSKINIGPALPYPLRLANVMDAQMRELLSPGPATHQRSPALNVTTSASAEVAAAGGLALSPTVFVSDGDVFTLSETASVEELDSRRRGLAGLSDGQILALVLLWLLVLVIPAAAWDANLPTEVQTLVVAYDGILANVAVAITFDILGKRKKR
jgi:hypothetical protein